LPGLLQHCFNFGAQRGVFATNFGNIGGSLRELIDVARFEKDFVS